MSKVDICVVPMRYDSQWGNWLPAEYESKFRCNGCEDEDSELHDSMTACEWAGEDKHYCDNCIDEAREDHINDLENDCDGLHICPCCGESFFDKNDYILHLMEEHEFIDED